MSRSWKKNSFCGITCSTSEKEDKERYHRKLRRINKQILDEDDDTLLRSVKEVSDPWLMSKDGKQRFDSNEHPDLMRK
jgi:hypothetical protein